MKRFSWILILAAAVWLTGCGGAADLVPHSSEAIGLSFDHPPEWVVAEEGAEIITASNQAAIDSAQYAQAAAVIFFVEPASRIGSDLVQFLEDEIAAGAGADIVSSPDETRINGNRAATVLIAQQQEGIPLLIGTTLIANGTDVIFVLSIYDRRQANIFEPQIQAITESVTFPE